MTEIVERFLYNRLNYEINFADQFNDIHLYNGTIIAKLLYVYKIINTNNFSLIIQHTDDRDVIRNNYRYIRDWLLLINIDIDDDIFNDLIDCKTSTLINLFYELYLTLNDRFYLNNKTKSIKVKKRHDVLIDKLSDVNILKTLLVINQDNIDWKRLSYEKLLECYKAKKDEYVEICKDTNEIKVFVDDEDIIVDEITKPLNDTVIDVSCNELLQELINIDNLDKLEYDDDEPKKLLQRIRKKIKEKEKLNMVRYKLYRILLQKLWEVIIKKQNRIFEDNLRKNILKQAAYEEQTITKELEEKETEKLHLDKLKAELKMLRKKEDALFTEKLLHQPLDENAKEYYQTLHAKLRLHRKLYEKKLMEKKERYKLFCEDVFNNLVDVAIKFTEHREQYKTNPNWMEQFLWKNLFVEGKQILDKIQSEYSLCSCEEEFDEIEQIDKIDTSILIENLFNKYLNYEEPFSFKFNTNNQICLETSRLGANILGHIVHLLLLTKYPKPSAPEPIDIPQVNIAVCLVGLKDQLVIPHLQKLLLEKNVVTIVIEDAIKYCLNAYEKERLMEYVDPPELLDNEEKKGKSKKGKDKKKGKSKDSDKKKEKSKGKSKEQKSKKSGKSDKSKGTKAPQEPLFSDKSLQTPYIYPCEDIILSEKASLGRKVNEFTNEGTSLTDKLKVSLLTEYIKSLQNINGWVIINFPETFIQAALLEEQLTGSPLLISQTDILESLSIFSEMRDTLITMKEEESLLQCRKSSLLRNPTPYPPDNFYDTYLTAFITLKEKMIDEESVKYVTVVDDDENEEEEVIELNPLEKFYTEQGCNYVYYYDTFDFPTVKQIGKIIIGDYRIPPKASFELFGANLVTVHTDMTAAPVKETTGKGKSKKQKAPKQKKKDKKKIVKIVMSDKGSQVPSVNENYDVLSVIKSVKSTTPYIEPEPGEPDWSYTSISMSYTNEYKLATIWETIEENYCANLRYFLLLHHYNINTHIPYTKYVKRFIEASTVFFDDKQQYINEFQETFNAIVENRSSYEQRALQCRIKDLHEILLSLTDQRTFYIESIRKLIINKNWVASQVIELLNIFIYCCQIEVNRCIETMTFINTYYNCIIKRKISSDSLDLIKNNNTIEHVCSDNDMYNVKCIQEYVKATLTRTSINVDTDPVSKVIDIKIEHCNELIKNGKTLCYDDLEKTSMLFNPSLTENYKRYAKTKNYVEPSKEVIDKRKNILKEWKCTIEGEYSRAVLRIELIKQVSKQEWKNIINLHTKQYYEIRNNLCECYEKDIANINNICEIFSYATMKRVPLPETITLNKANDYYNKYRTLLTKEESEENVLFKKVFIDYRFTYVKLQHFIDILYNLAPNGFILKQSFIYVIQDFIVCNEGKQYDIVPNDWYNLEPYHIEYLINRLYGKMETIDWKDFIIRNLFIDFPTHEELLNMRKEFEKYDPDRKELITIRNFYDINLWYETIDTFTPDFYNYTREILIRLFHVDKNYINYTKLLFLFCKDDNGIEGFAKAIELSIGNYVCYDYELGKDFVDIIMSQRYEHEQLKILREKELEEVQNLARSIVGSTIDTVVHLCDDILIEDYYSEASKNTDDIDTNEIYGEGTIAKEEKVAKEPKVEEEEEDISIFSNFTNVSIGFECRQYVNMTYILPYETLRTLLFAFAPRSFPIHETYMDKINVIYEQCKREDFNNEVLIHEFLNNVHFQELLKEFHKFKIEHLEVILLELASGKICLESKRSKFKPK